MHVLMISIDPALLDPASDAVKRHLEYARLAGTLTILVLARTRVAPVAPFQIESLHLLPVLSVHPILYPLSASRAVLPRDLSLIITQDTFLSGWIGWRLAQRLNIPLLAQNHTTLFGNRAWRDEHPLRNRALLMLTRFLLTRIDYYRTVNERERDYAVRHGFPVDRAVALPMATATTPFFAPLTPEARTRIRADYALAPDDRVILWVGHPIGFKRLAMLFRIFAAIMREEANARLLIVGAGDEERAFAQSAGIADRGVIIGKMAHADLPAIYALGDVYALTSSYEGVPRVLVEASAAGLPLIGFAVPGVDEVIEDGVNGYLVQEGDEAAFADRLLMLVRDPALARLMGESAQRLATERFNAERYAERWVGMWREAMEKGKRKGARKR